MKQALLYTALALLAAALTAAFAPLEKTLGVNARLVYLHGAWVWAAMAGFINAALAGFAGLSTRRSALQRWSQALGWSALLFWLLFLPQSLYVMQANWNGLFLDEPRFRGPLNLAIVGLLLQLGLTLLPLRWTAAANVGFAVVLLYSMTGAQSVLHPDSPIFTSGAGGIQLFFGLMLIFLVLAVVQLAYVFKQFTAARELAE